jgi:hypothetical protein
MANKYTLVIPYIEGTMKKSVKSENSQKAANAIYKNLSEHFNNSVPSFHFTIMKGTNKNGKLYHFEVNETRENDEVSFTINQMKNIKGVEKLEEKFKEKLEQIKDKLKKEQDGGKKHKKSKKHAIDDSSDSDLSSSSDYKRAKSYIPTNMPISYWWYDPSIYRLDSVYIPTLYSYLAPRMEYATILLY